VSYNPQALFVGENVNATTVESPEKEKQGRAKDDSMSLIAGPSGSQTPRLNRPRRNIILLLSAAIVASAVVFSLWKERGSATQSGEQNSVVATAKRGDFVRRLRVQGTVEAVSFHAIAAPRLSGPGSGTLIVTKLIASGKTVKKGELLVEFDRQTQIKNALDRQADYVDLVQQIEKKRADQAAAQAVDQTALKQAENAMNSASLELKRNEIVSRIDAEKNQENFEEAKATFEQLRSTFDLKRKAALAELRSLEIQRDRAKSATEYAKKNTERLAIVSPIDGIVVLNTIWKGGQMGEVQEGDEVRPGVPFMQVVNAGAMLVRSRVNQADISSLSAGQTVHVGLDAYPDLSFGGKIERIAAIGVTSGLSQKVRTFQVLFTIDGTDAKLMPDLSASVDVELAKKSSVLLVPRDAVITEGTDDYVLTGSAASFQKTKVKLGEKSDTQIVIESGVEEGAQVLRNAAQYEKTS
jgi:HlyD family secretion protein